MRSKNLFILLILLSVFSLNDIFASSVCSGFYNLGTATKQGYVELIGSQIVVGDEDPVRTTNSWYRGTFTIDRSNPVVFVYVEANGSGLADENTYSDWELSGADGQIAYERYERTYSEKRYAYDLTNYNAPTFSFLAIAKGSQDHIHAAQIRFRLECAPRDSFTAYVPRFDDELECYTDYMDFSKCEIVGPVTHFGEYIKVGDDIPDFLNPASYRHSFILDSTYTTFVLHDITHFQGHEQAQEFIRWSLRIDGILIDSFNYSGNKEELESHMWLMDLSAYAGKVATFSVWTQDCNVNVHAANMCFAFGCMPPLKIDKEYCEPDDSLTLRLHNYKLFENYSWYKQGVTGYISKGSPTLKVKPNQGATYTIVVERTGNISTTRYFSVSTTDDVSECATFYQLDTVYTALPYLWREQICNQHGVLYFDSLNNVCGCDSIYALVLYEPPFSKTDSTTLCEGDSLIWHGQKITTAGVYSDSLKTIHGADSVYTLKVKQTFATTSAVTYTKCKDKPIDINGKLIYAPCTLMDTINNHMGCDSIITITIKEKDCSTPGPHPWPSDPPINPRLDCDTAYSTTYRQIYEKELPTFQWNGIPMNQIPHNDHQDTTLIAPLKKADQSCDSIATLHLHVLFPCELPATYQPVYYRKE